MNTCFRPLFLFLSFAPAAAPLVQAQSVNLTGSSIRLFEQGPGFVLGPERRIYTSYFNTLRTHYIGVEATLEYTPASAAFTLAIGCQMTRPDGTVIDGIFKIPARVAAGSTSAVDANALFGPGKAGWQPGIYKVTCSATRQIGETSFQMSPGPSLLADVELRLKGVQFFPTGARLTPQAERQYLDRFASAEATRIGIELSLVHAAPGRSGEIPIDCYYLTPSGVVLGTLNLEYQLEAAATGGTVARGIGWDQPGHWSKGDYLAVCQIHGRPISVDRFTVW
jgi:hypothetical protein